MFQVILNGLSTGAYYALLGVGFGLVYSVTGFFYFMYAAYITLGAYLAFLFSSVIGVPSPYSYMLAIITTTTVACILHRLIFGQIDSNRTSPYILLIVSLAMYVIFENTIALSFGDETRTLHTNIVQEGLKVWSAHITKIQLLVLLICAVSTTIVFIILRKSRLGKFLRAVASDTSLAEVCGVSVQRVQVWSIVIGSTIAATTGILRAYDVTMSPGMGMPLLMIAVIAALVGKSYNVIRITVAGLALGIFQHFAAWFIGTQWQDAIAFLILLCLLFLKSKKFLLE